MNFIILYSLHPNLAYSVDLNICNIYHTQMYSLRLFKCRDSSVLYIPTVGLLGSLFYP